MTVPDEVLAGVHRFNERDYFEAHEAWEDHWGLGGPDEREVTLGLIKAAVALLHLRNGNEHGFQWQAEQSVPALRRNAHVWPELRTDDLAEAMEGVIAQLRFHGEVPESEFPYLPVPAASSEQP